MLDPDSLLALLGTDAVVLLPSARAVRSLRERFDRQQRERGLLAWDAPEVFAWEEWTANLWSSLTLDGADDRILLNRLQEELLWADIIADTPLADNAPERLRDRGSLRELGLLARSAFALAAAHEALDRLPRAADSFDSRAFAGWQRAFTRRCHTERLLPKALLEAALAQHLRTGHIAPGAPVHLAGFEVLTPAQGQLLAQLGRSGTAVLQHALQWAAPQPNPLPPPASVTLETPEAELRWALQTVRDLAPNAAARSAPLALILPDPAGERAALDSLLREVLAPELEPVFADLSSTPWHFSAGDPLARQPVIRDALSLLRWLTAELPLEEIGALVLSPSFLHTDDLETRVRFEAGPLRRAVALRPELGLGSFLDLVTRHHRRTSKTPGPRLTPFQAVQDLLAASRRQRQTASFGDWAEFVRNILRAVGWPGPRTASPAEFRASEAWESLLDLLATLDLRSRRLDLRGFLALLHREAEALPFSAGSENAPVQFLRLAETPGCLFAGALVLRSTDDLLPTPERPHPLLGWALQQSLGLPGANPARTQARTRQLLESLQARSGHLLFSRAAADSNGEFRPSPLPSLLGAQPLAPSLPVSAPAPVPLLRMEDNTPLPPLPSLHVEGGARVLELQAACGFHAFADLRLGATQPEAGRLGLDPRDAGTYLHKALELLWAKLQSQAALRAMPDPDRQATIRQAIADALTKLRERVLPDDAWAEAFLDILQQRYSNLLLNWLNQELARGAFTVLPPEQKKTVTVGPLHLTIRPDRIDAVENGRVYIDYKSSADLATKDWLGERPRLPQLPLYALLSEAEPSSVRGLAFARVRAGTGMAWISLEDEPGIFPAKARKALHNLEDQLALWRTELDRLAQAFAEGDTSVDPRSYPHTCGYCGHRLLCRLDATTLLANADEKPDSLAEGDILG